MTAIASGPKRNLAVPFEEEDRDKDDADTQGGDERRHRDLLGPVQDGAERAASLISQVPVDVLDLHGGVVHQDAHGERQPPEGHRC